MFFTTDLPTDLRSGYKIRIYNLMKKLSEKYELVVVHIGDNKIDKIDSLIIINKYYFIRAREKSIKSMLNSYLSFTPFLAYRFTPVGLQSIVDEIIRSNDISAIYLNLTVYDILLPKNVDMFIDQHDIISHTMKEASSGASSLLRRTIYAIEAYRWPKYEKNYYKRFDSKRLKVISVKDEDKIETEKLVTKGSVYTVENGHSVELTKVATSEWEPKLLFVGTSHERNVNALRIFYFEILPKIKERYPKIKLKIVGAFEASDLAFISAKYNNISIHTYVDDISEYYRYGDIQVLPFCMGAGSKLKVFESFANGVPVVGTPLAFTGVPLGKLSEALCSYHNTDIVELIFDILNDKNLYDSISQELKSISQDFNWNRIIENSSCL